MKKMLMTMMVSLFVIGGVSVAQATMLVPDILAYVPLTSGVPDYGTLLVSTGLQSFSSTFGGETITGKGTENVYRNTTGLLFEYTVQMDSLVSTKGFGSFSAYNFDSFTVDAGYDLAKNLDPNYYPNQGKNSDGTVYIDFSHALKSDNGATLYLQTTAKEYEAGGYSLLGWGTADVRGYQPKAVTATPEPASAALLGTGLMGLLGFRKKRVV